MSRTVDGQLWTNLSLQQQFPLLRFQLFNTCFHIMHLLLVFMKAVNIVHRRFEYRTFAVHLFAVDAADTTA